MLESTVARTREFDVDLTLNKAIELFWQKGYSNTSMRMLVKYTGVSHSGLYTAFGNKDELFLIALKHYESSLFKYLFAGIENPKAGKKEIVKLFSFVSAANKDKYFKHGCFIVNTALEFTDGDSSVTSILRRTYRRQVDAFKNALSNGKEAGDFKPSIDIDAQAANLAVLFYGCSSLTRINAPSQSIHLAISAALGNLR